MRILIPPEMLVKKFKLIFGKVIGTRVAKYFADQHAMGKLRIATLSGISDTVKGTALPKGARLVIHAGTSAFDASEALPTSIHSPRSPALLP